MKNPKLYITTYFNGDENDFILLVLDSDKDYIDLNEDAVKAIKEEQGGNGDEWAEHWSNVYSDTVQVYPVHYDINGYSIKLEKVK